MTIGELLLAPVLAECRAIFPAVEVLQLTDRPVELVAEHIDVAIRAGEVPDSSQLCVAIAQATGAASPVDAASRQFCPGSGW